MAFDLSDVLSKEGFLGEFLTSYDEARERGWGQQIGMEVQSGDVPSVEYPWMGSAPMVREWTGSRHKRTPPKFKYTLENIPFEASMGFKKEQLRRDRFAGRQTRIAAMGEKAGLHRESKFSTLLQTNGTCYDGKAFFATNHEEGDSGAQSNAETFPVVSASAVTPLEAARALRHAARVLTGFLDSEAEPVQEDPQGFLAMYPDELAESIGEALEEGFVANGSSVVSNPAGGLRKKVKGIHNARLSTSTDLFLFVTDGSLKPLLHQIETGWEVETLEEGSDKAFYEREYVYGVNYFGNFGYGDWRKAVRVRFTTA